MKSFINIFTLKVLGGLTLLILLSSESAAQERFNIRYDSQFPSTNFKSVIEVDDGYLCTGFLSDTLDLGGGRPTIYAKFNFEGELLFQKTYGGTEDLTERHLGSQNPDLQHLDNGNIIHSGVTFDSDWIRQGYIMTINQEADTLNMFRYYSPNYMADYPYNSLLARRVEQSSDGNYLMLSGVAAVGTGSDLVIQKYTPEGELLWTYDYATEQDPDYMHTILPTNDGGGISIASLDVVEGESSRLHFFKYNIDGEEEWEFYTNPEFNLASVRDALLDDEELVCATAHVDWEAFEGIPSVLKIDMLGNIVWMTTIWEDDYDRYHSSRQIVKTIDESGYVLGGRHSILASGSANISSGFLAKVSTEGELMWDRKYKYFDLGDDEHEFYDLRATSDGGFIFCGEANADDNGTLEVSGPYQQGWLVKVDEFGCLVEGCQLFDNVEENYSTSKEYFKSGPVPATDFLNIYQINKLSPLAVYELYDLNGRLIKSIPSASGRTTIMVDVSTLQSGQYILGLKEGGELLQKQKIIKD